MGCRSIGPPRQTSALLDRPYHQGDEKKEAEKNNEAARLCELAKQREEGALASDAALTRASDDEAAAWAVTDRTVLRGRLEATGLASPVV